MQNDHYAHKIKEIMSFKDDDYEILLYFNFQIFFFFEEFNFQILLVDGTKISISTTKKHYPSPPILIFNGVNITVFF